MVSQPGEFEDHKSGDQRWPHAVAPVADLQASPSALPSFALPPCQVARAVPEFYYPSEVIIQNRDSAEKMYIISSGVVQEMPSATTASSVNAEEDAEHAVTLIQGCVRGWK